MSIIDQANHNVVSYTSGVTKPFSGQRLSVISYKTCKDKLNPLCNIKRDSKAVSLPVISGSEVYALMSDLLPHITTMLENTQDKIIREILDSNTNVKFISRDEITIGSCIQYLETSNESGRMTTESVKQWFDSELKDSIMIALSDKLGLSDVVSDEDVKKIQKITDEFRTKISALSSGATKYGIKVSESLLRALEYANDSDVTAVRFKNRLNKMIFDEKMSEDNMVDTL